jgi:RNA polymerase sigma factor (sigma-70 family)
MRMPGDSSTTLVLLRDHAAAGDRRALNALLEELYVPIERFLRRRLTSGHASSYIADVTQEALIRIARSIETCRAPTDRQLMAWALTVARNAAVDVMRSNMMWYSLTALPESANDVAREDSDGDGNASVARGDRVLRSVLSAAQSSLSEETQEILWRRLILGEEWAEVAVDLSTTESGAKRRYQRAQHRLRGELRRRIYSLPARTRALVLSRLRQSGVDDITS